MEQPIYYWDPSIAPSGMAFYTGDKFPGLARQPASSARSPASSLRRLVLDGDKVVARGALLHELASASATCARARTASSIC